MSKWHDATLGAIFNQVAEEFGESPAAVRDIYESYFHFAAQIMAMPDMPTVDIVGIGKFQPRTRAVRQMIEHRLQRDGDAAVGIPQLRENLDRLEKERDYRKRNKNKCRHSNQQ